MCNYINYTCVFVNENINGCDSNHFVSVATPYFLVVCLS